MQTGYIEKTEQDRTIELMCQILELKESSEFIVKKTTKEVGVRQFFDHFESLDIEEVEKDRVRALKVVIEQKELEIIKRGGFVDGNN